MGSPIDTLLADPMLGFLAPAVDPAWMAPRLAAMLGRSLSLCAIRPLRHKPGRRCLIAYDVELERGPEPVTVLGKVRARGLDDRSHDLQRQLWQGGFDDASPDRVSVPQPLGVIPEMNMWLQRWVPGTMATVLLPTHTELAGQIAGAIAKLHQLNLPTTKRHTPADEIRILQERLPRVLSIYPQWQNRLDAVLHASVAMAKTLPLSPMTGIHRDFYPDQVLVRAEEHGLSPRLYLLDLDLYCQGDPALDIGNFVAHLSEQSLRTYGHPNGLIDQETTLIDAFCHLAGEHHRQAIDRYKTLTLVRHIYISTQIPGRQATTAPLLHLCETRLALGS
jgi:hypothetical protein